MDMKGRWGKVIGWPLAVAALVGQSFIGYVTENGQLPPWMPEKLGWLASLLSTDIPLPLWTIVLFVVSVSVVLVIGVKDAIAVTDQGASIARLQDECEKREQRSVALETQKASLMEQLVEKTQALEAMEAQKAVAVSAIGHKVLATVAKCTDRNVIPTLSTIAASIRVGHVETHAAIDVLIDKGFLSRASYSDGPRFRFTPAGRAFYVKHLEQQRQP